MAGPWDLQVGQSHGGIPTYLVGTTTISVQNLGDATNTVTIKAGISPSENDQCPGPNGTVTNIQRAFGAATVTITNNGPNEIKMSTVPNNIVHFFLQKNCVGEFREFKEGDSVMYGPQDPDNDKYMSCIIGKDVWVNCYQHSEPSTRDPGVHEELKSGTNNDLSNLRGLSSFQVIATKYGCAIDLRLRDKVHQKPGEFNLLVTVPDLDPITMTSYSDYRQVPIEKMDDSKQDILVKITVTQASSPSDIVATGSLYFRYDKKTGEISTRKNDDFPKNMSITQDVRHGESIWNQENKFTGWTDVDLSEKGYLEAKAGGKKLKEAGYEFDLAYTSVLKRAIHTCNIVLDELDLAYIPVDKQWRLNERMYGDLQGLNKAETARKYGDEQVHIWRRSYDIQPPALEASDPRFPGHDKRYANLDVSLLPKTECLKDTVDRFLPLWLDNISVQIKSGKKVLIAAHGNSIRALIKYLDNVPDDKIVGVEIPTGVPLVYELDENLKPTKPYYYL
eukprot:gene4630-5783_t